MIPDDQLLRRYTQDGDEAAFAELVRRYVDLVFSAALRLTSGDSAMAQDVSQSVFTDLARKAWKLSGRTTISGWLHTSVRFAAAKARRGEMRRRTHEQEAFAMQDTDSPESEIHWEQLRPVLDEAVGGLREGDRDAVVLRFLQNKSHREVGEALGLNEEAARKRVDRALEKLRDHFAQRGVTVSAALLASVMASNSIMAAPAGLAATMTGTALASVASATFLTSIAQTLYLAMKTKTIVIAAVVLSIAAVPAIIEHQQIVQLREQLDHEKGRLTSTGRKISIGHSEGDVAAFGKIMAISSRSARLRSLIDLAAGLDASGVRTLLDDLMKRPGTDDDRVALSILMERLVQLDPKNALAWAKAQSPRGQESAMRALFAAWTGIDPAAALAGTNEIANAEGRKMLQSLVLSDLTNYDPLKAVALLQSLPAMQESRNFRAMYGAVFSTWASNDPAAASAAVMNLPTTRMRIFAIQNVVDGWAAVDPQGALAWAQKLPAGAPQNNALAAALNGLASRDPAAAINYASSLPEGVNRNDYLSNIATRWSESDPAAALSWADQNLTGSTGDRAIQSIISRLALTDPASAMTYVNQMPDNPVRDNAITALATSWANSDPQAALNWMQGLNGEKGATPTVLSQMVNIVNDWAVIDPRGTAAYVQTLQDTPDYGRLMAQIGANWASADPNTARTWAQSLPAGKGYNEATKAIVTAIAVQDPQTAWNDAGQLLTGDDRTQALSNIIGKWSAQNPAQAAPALAALPEGDLLNKATSTLATNWLKHDPNAASQWINTLPQGDARDGAVSQLIATEGVNNLPVAFNWALTIGNAETQVKELGGVVDSWAKRDRAAAANAVRSSNLSEPAQTALLKVIEAAKP